MKKPINNFLLAFALAFALEASTAQAEGNTHESDLGEARLLADVTAVTPGEAFWLTVHIKPKPGWHTYWQNPGDSGISASVKWLETPPGMEEAIGPIHWPAPERIKTGDLVNYGYHGEVYLPIPVSALEFDEAPASLTFTAKVDWLLCKDICVPETATLTLTLPTGKAEPSKQAAVIHGWVKRVPAQSEIKGEYRVEGNDVVMKMMLPAENITSVEFFPIDDGIIANNALVETHLTDTGLELMAPRGNIAPADPLRAVLSVSTRDGVKHLATEFALKSNVQPAIAAPIAPVEKEPLPVPTLGLTTALLFAFLGGLILNIMPCVLPILSLKALSLTRKGASPRADGIAYTAGVLATFTAIAGAMIALQAAGSAVGWGFQLQAPGFVTALVYLMFTMGLGLSGAYTLPSMFSGAGDSLTHKGGVVGSFFTGAFAVVVATPCTAPFMAPAIGFALTQPPIGALLIFLSLGLGMALPFLLIGVVPALARALPKPGAWMETFKQFLAFPMYLTAVWLLWVLVKQAGPAGVAIALLGCVLIAFTIWLWKFSATWMRFYKWVLLLLLALALGFSVSIQSGQLSCASPIEMLQEGIASEYYSSDRLAELRAKGTPVFVNATADWCITCQFNERIALDTSSVKQAFRDKSVTVMIADWTDQDDAISEYLKRFGRRGVPLYVLYPPQGEPVVLPQILTPKIVLDALEKI